VDSLTTKFSKALKSKAKDNQKKGTKRKHTLPKEKKNSRFILYTEKNTSFLIVTHKAKSRYWQEFPFRSIHPMTNLSQDHLPKFTARFRAMEQKCV
jgi:hypothetical protein